VSGNDNSGVVLMEMLLGLLIVIIGFHLDNKLGEIIRLLKPADSAKDTPDAK
jgi:hypothetical protein